MYCGKCLLYVKSLSQFLLCYVINTIMTSNLDRKCLFGLQASSEEAKTECQRKKLESGTEAEAKKGTSDWLIQPAFLHNPGSISQGRHCPQWDRISPTSYPSWKCSTGCLLASLMKTFSQLRFSPLGNLSLYKVDIN